MAAMAQYDGTIIVVSHNRYFLDHFTNKTLEIKDGKAVVYEGNISYYLEKTRALQEENPPLKGKKKTIPAQEQPVKKKSKQQRKAEAKARQELSRKTGPLKKLIAAREKEIATLEKNKTDLEQDMADPELYQDQDAFNDKSSQYGKVGQQLERAYGAWEKAQEELEKIS